MAIVGYARVSTDGQSLDAQVAELKAAGATTVHQEKVSGTIADRAALKRALGSVQAGDVLLVTRLDRLARSTRDLLNILDALRNEAAGFRSLRDPWADTTTAHGRLMLTVWPAWPNSSANSSWPGPANDDSVPRIAASDLVADPS